jgi:hypothetical protein
MEAGRSFLCSAATNNFDRTVPGVFHLHIGNFQLSGAVSPRQQEPDVTHHEKGSLREYIIGRHRVLRMCNVYCGLGYKYQHEYHVLGINLFCCTALATSESLHCSHF